MIPPPLPFSFSLHDPLLLRNPNHLDETLTVGSSKPFFASRSVPSLWPLMRFLNLGQRSSEHSWSVLASLLQHCHGYNRGDVVSSSHSSYVLWSPVQASVSSIKPPLRMMKTPRNRGKYKQANRETLERDILRRVRTRWRANRSPRNIERCKSRLKCWGPLDMSLWFIFQLHMNVFIHPSRKPYIFLFSE